LRFALTTARGFFLFRRPHLSNFLRARELFRSTSPNFTVQFFSSFFLFPHECLISASFCWTQRKEKNTASEQNRS
jgi:hypothetical protein